jgi:hypothetical protein
MPSPMHAAILSGGMRRPYVDAWFAANRFLLNGISYSAITAVPGFTFTRASTAAFFGSDGLLQTASSGVPRLTHDPATRAPLGLLIEESRENRCLWNRDLTNAVWVPVLMTAALTETGIDGVANSASRITATGTAAVILQTATLASSTRQQSAWVKRVTGSGVVEMTTNGTTWVAVTVTADWTRVTIPAVAAVVNPVFGFRIMTSGDAIAVDFVQNETGTGASSEIATTTTAVTRAADDATITGLIVPDGCTVAYEGRVPAFVSTDARLSLSDGGTTNRMSAVNTSGNLNSLVVAGGTGTTILSVAGTPSAPFKMAINSGGGRYSASINGSAATSGAGPVNNTLTQFDLGKNSGASIRYWNSPIARVRAWTSVLPVQALSQ